MAALSWLLIPVVAALVAGIWSSWASRRKTGIPDADGVAGYERFRAAMERPRPEQAQEEAAEEAAPKVTAVKAPAPAPDGPAPAAD
jgi:hypothetical protein